MLLAAMVRPEDTIRAPQSYHNETSEEEGQEPPYEALTFTDPSYQPPPPAMKQEPPNPLPAAEPSQTNSNRPPVVSRLLTQEETMELARRAVENGLRETKRSLAGSEDVSDAVKPKLTIDLGYSNIVRIPEPVVDIIKDEVERLSLSNNQIFHIPYRFAECTCLRYLNIRTNNFREFPKGVYKLPLLEILDLSRNKISKIPEEIKNLTSLRVFSIMQNRLDDLPLGIADMNKLQILKVSGNALKYPLRRVLEDKEEEVASSSMTDNQKEVAVTAALKQYLKSRQPAVVQEFESGSEAGENVTETPKPVKRGVNSRFPVIPSTGSDNASESRSPSISRPPPIPTRSHYRMASGQGMTSHNGLLTQRPGSALGSSSNERNRSNSEGIIQGSNARVKRMGLITRKNTDLDTLDETRSYRNSHYRGLSHGSILRNKPAGGANGGSTSSSPSSPREKRRLRDGFVRRMSSLPEHKIEVRAKEPILEGAKGILYSLFQIHPHISMLINVIKGDEPKRNNLEIVSYNASTHVDQLNEALENAENADPEDIEFVRQSNEAVKRECETCIIAYTHVGTQLQNNADKIVSHGDPRYVRSLMLMIYGSLIELRNACKSLGIGSNVPRPSSISKENRMASHTEEQQAGPDHVSGPTATPTKERPQNMRRLRSETTIQHPNIMPAGKAPPALNPPSTGDFPGPYPIMALNPGGRSRSGSRSNTTVSSSGHSSTANTPRSGETFGAISTPVTTRINPVTGLDEIEEERIFEKIFVQLTNAYTTALQALPLVCRQFSRCLEIAEENRSPPELRTLWNNLVYRCRICIDASEALRLRLSNMKLKEPGGGMRNQREFWQLCTSFMQSFVILVNEMREAKSLQLLSPDVVAILRPVQKASREAGRLIDASPWSYLADMNGSNSQPNGGYPSLLNPHHAQHQTSSSASTVMTNASTAVNSGSSPQFVSLPATPLSAALGPAAQATVPSTPASAYSDRFFAGDVFQRADSLLSMPAPAPMLYRR